MPIMGWVVSIPVFCDSGFVILNPIRKAIVQRTVGLRTRLPEAESTLAGLKSNYDEHVLSSIADNPELAAASLDEAEKLLDKARGVQAQPAGQHQGHQGLVD